jgi:hypothetical protein
MPWLMIPRSSAHRSGVSKNQLRNAARAHRRLGREVLWCDVGDENSDAVIKFPITQISPHFVMRLKSFRLFFWDVWRGSSAAARH